MTYLSTIESIKPIMWKIRFSRIYLFSKRKKARNTEVALSMFSSIFLGKLYERKMLKGQNNFPEFIRQ